MTEIKTFADVRRKLLTLPNQCNGNIAYACETGEEYREFLVACPSRPGDVLAVEKCLSTMFDQIVFEYLNRTKGTIYWRVKPEFFIEPYQVMITECDNGTDKDFITEKKGYADKNWVMLKAYCRVVRSDRPAIYNEAAA